MNMAGRLPCICRLLYMQFGNRSHFTPTLVYKLNFITSACQIQFASKQYPTSESGSVKTERSSLPRKKFHNRKLDDFEDWDNSLKAAILTQSEEDRFGLLQQSEHSIDRTYQRNHGNGTGASDRKSEFGQKLVLNATGHSSRATKVVPQGKERTEINRIDWSKTFGTLTTESEKLAETSLDDMRYVISIVEHLSSIMNNSRFTRLAHIAHLHICTGCKLI